MHNYVRIVPRDGKVSMQIVIPKNFLSTVALKANYPEYMRQAKDEALAFWETIASQKLNSTRQAYLEAITAKQTALGNIVLTLDGEDALRVENGFEPFDMKIGFSKSSKLKQGPIKMPAAKREKQIGPKKAPEAYQWMIIPIETDGLVKFRTFTTKQSSDMWWHPGVKGIKAIDEVKRELKDRILPNTMSALFKDSFK